MNRAFLVVAVGALALSAQAQESKPAGIAVRAGLFMPSGSAAKAIGKTWVAAGATMRLKETNYGMGPAGSSELGVSLDYMGKGSASAMPILMSFTSHNNDTYYVVGGGLSFNRLAASSTTRFAYSFGFGRSFMKSRTPLFMEVRYWGNSNTELSGIAGYIGVHI